MEKKDLTISQMMQLSYELWEKHKDTWSPMEPEYGKDFILYMIEEIGEVIQIIKKKKTDKIMNDSEIREKFVEELGDVLMFFIDVLNRYKISHEEFAEIYLRKFNKNMVRDFEKDHAEA